MAPIPDTGETVFSFHLLSHGLNIAAVPDVSEILFVNLAQRMDFFPKSFRSISCIHPGDVEGKVRLDRPCICLSPLSAPDRYFIAS